MKYIDGNLIDLALKCNFDVIAHGCNCFCKQKKGIAADMVKNFYTDNFSRENIIFQGDINKLGTIDYATTYIKDSIVKSYSVQISNNTLEKKDFFKLIIINAYTQFDYRRFVTDEDVNIDYSALNLCLKKINYIFKGKSIGLPKIGAGLAGGDWSIIEKMIQKELKDMDVTVVNYVK
jgi:O-acetyl-ADP-ribose deacetylase (regulator of RNase III)